MPCKTEAAVNDTSKKIFEWINFCGFAKIQ